MSDITLWKPEPDVLLHQGLGKACEEAGELTKILARCLIQGIDGVDPGTGKSNRQALFDEIADIDAAVRWLRELVNDQYDAARADRKLNGFRLWQQMLEEDAQQVGADDDTYQCPICGVAINDDDLCAADIEMGTCHAACLEGSPVVDLETGEPTDGKAGTFRYGDTAPGSNAHV
ncbi:hypothetical protein PPF1_63 [Rhizobium phage vB_RleM_PPF1]|uniref:nucleoside triphosphate pyrophosphohydrolase n=1 Tax=Rhizobium phage vB_RleM_PPF1 TaxID=1498228 RepID=UPI000499BF9D|nr:nucleoside triphosphate pyrophosphohydrolase [Rhizobium phage vB_RleM_PPF1]AID18376.1 hypothetical protein PPF1_63 [Rhizobium phage vB_RleM_PPF1]